MVEDVSFTIVKNKCATVVSMFVVEDEPEWPLHAYFDASGYGVGFCLCQKVDGVEHPVAYDSMTLSKAERNYGTYKRELLAMVKFATKYHYHFENLIWKTLFFTDHKPLTTFLNSTKLEGIYARWAIKMRPYNIEIRYIEGTRNRIADGLSRTIFPEEEPAVVKEIADEILEKKHDPEWYWKDGKGGFEEMVRNVLAKGSAVDSKEQKILDLIHGSCECGRKDVVQGEIGSKYENDKEELGSEVRGQISVQARLGRIFEETVQDIVVG